MKLFKKRETTSAATGSPNQTSPAASLDRTNGTQQQQQPQQSPTPASALSASLNQQQVANGSQQGVFGVPQNVQRPPQQQQQHGSGASGRESSMQYPWSSRRISNNNPFPRYGHATNAQSGKDGGIYIFGGLVRDAAMGDLWLLSPQDMQAKPLSTTGEQPSARVGHAALLIGNAFIVFGGDTKLNGTDANPNNDDSLYLLNTTTKIWTVAKVAGAKPSGRYGHTLNMLGPKVLVFGGQVEGFFFNDLVAFDLNTLNSAAPRWELITPLEGCEPPPSRTNHIAISHHDKLYVFGGTNGVEWFNDMWRFDPVTRAWQMLKCSGFVPQPREGHSAALVGDVIYIFGGRDVDGNDLGDLSAFKISSSRWFTFQNMGPCPSPRSGHALCSVGGKKIYVIGGEGASSRGDEQQAYILDTTKIRYPSDSKNGGKTGEGASNGSKDVPIDGAPVRSRNSAMPPVEPASIRSVSGQSTTSPSRLPQLNSSRQVPPEMARLPRRTSTTPMSQWREDAIGLRNTSMPNPPAATAPDKSVSALKRSGSLDSMMDPKDTPVQSQPRVEDVDNTRLNRARSMEEMKAKKTRVPVERMPPAEEPEKVHRLAPALRHLDSDNFESRALTATLPENGVHSPAEAATTRNSAGNEQDRGMTRMHWLETELKLAQKAGYVASDDSQEVSKDLPGGNSEVSQALVTMRNQLMAMNTDMTALKIKAQESIAAALSERDVALKEAAFERSRHVAMVNMDSERLKTMELQRSESLETQLLNVSDQAKGFERQINSLQSELTARKRTREDHEALMERHSRAAADAEQRHDDLLAQHNTTRSILAETQAAVQEHQTKLIEAQSALSQREIDSTKLKELEETHAEHLVAHEATNAATAAATARASQAEVALDGERQRSGELQSQIMQLQAQLESSKAEMVKQTALREEMEKAMLAAREEAEHSRNAMTSGIDNLITQQQARGPHDPVHHQATIDSLQRELEQTKELHTSSRTLAESHATALQEAQARIQDHEKTHVKHTLDMLALQRRMTNTQAELQDMQAKHVALSEEHTATRAQLDESNLRFSGLQQIMSARPSRRDSIEKRRSRNLSSPMPSSNGRISQTPDAGRLRELEVKLAESQQLQREMQLSHAKATEAMTSRNDESHGVSENPMPPTNGSSSSDDHESRLRNANDATQLAQARATEAERQLSESTANFTERLGQLEADYQSAVHYVKGTEKMLRRMKEELGKYKTANARLQTQLEEHGASPRSLENGGSATEKDMTALQSQLTHATKEKDALTREVAKLKEHLDATIAEHGTKITALQNQLTNQRETSESLEQRTTQSRQLEDELEEAHLATRKLEFENRELERGMQESEAKVKMLLDQFEHSVDNYRRQSVLMSESSDVEPTRGNESGEHVLAPPLISTQGKPRTSSTLDLLANELDQLRHTWESDSRKSTYRTSGADSDLQSLQGESHPQQQQQQHLSPL